MLDSRAILFRRLYELAKEDSNIILLCADQSHRELDRFYADLPKQIYNVGISEQNMISVAAGLALSGKKVFVHAICTFLVFRAFEQIRNDIGLMDLPVTLLGIGAGETYKHEGKTHQAGKDDETLLRTIGKMLILTPETSDEIINSLDHCLAHPRPSYIKIGRNVLN